MIHSDHWITLLLDRLQLWLLITWQILAKFGDFESILLDFTHWKQVIP
jgi:hypothetical protein